MSRIKAVFLSNKESLESNIKGGVQICSQEFHDIISSHPEIELVDYFVPYTKKISQRISIKIGFENYSIYDVGKYATGLIEFLKNERAAIVFINMASLVRFARPIKLHFGTSIKIILLSHGNHSGDFLHLITKPIGRETGLRKLINKIRLGFLISTEASYRVNYLDGVAAMSETEKQIENWFGSRRVTYIPRRLKPDFLPHHPIAGRVGFVGRLDHPPNLQGLTMLLDELKQAGNNKVEVRLVGSPLNYGEAIVKDYSFITYLGELSDKNLEKEVCTWSGFLNPVWWYATGASTKLAVGIGWGIPVFTSIAGARGYEWKAGQLIIANSPSEMAKRIAEEITTIEKVQYWSEQTKIVANSSFTINELSERLISLCK